MRGLLALIVVGCDGRPAEMVRQTIGGRTLLDLAVQQAVGVRPERILVSVPREGPAGLASACGVECLERPPNCNTLEDALAQALADAAAVISHVLCLDPLLPLRRPDRLAQAVAQARRENADCVFSCHREAALLWHRSAMGLVPYFDPARLAGPGAEAADPPWLREDGSLYLLTAASFRRTRCRHGGRLTPLETAPQEAVVADGPAGLAACRALAAQRARCAAAAG